MTKNVFIKLKKENRGKKQMKMNEEKKMNESKFHTMPNTETYASRHDSSASFEVLFVTSGSFKTTGSLCCGLSDIGRGPCSALSQAVPSNSFYCPGERQIRPQPWMLTHL
ncbi:uncharacterized protein ASCRUDRAFT_72911 [Ascoidea rubescens DSM 1968]|uniref:Uncharacterized protein n=1 Tax=Ascoidea rubescens DSM 1968 TaxID=1344418 RepID=A0A1D2V8T9_9ASCO|nr:hypothetical protein ASCRUDRAFT_72911 [Ascoidea rubescens DSM 1968]ODV58050.1 hypothetical protein ASCRUDRAFT_72911 [Ascoidea rubescens DSM 1968]